MRRRTAQSIEEHKASGITEGSEPEAKASKRGKHPNSRKNLKPFPPGTSGNPGGLPGSDLAALYARRFFEANPGLEAVAKELGKMGLNAYAYSVLADRGYGKIKDRVSLEDPNGKPLSFTVKFVKPKSGDGS